MFSKNGGPALVGDVLTLREPFQFSQQFGGSLIALREALGQQLGNDLFQGIGNIQLREAKGPRRSVRNRADNEG